MIVQLAGLPGTGKTTLADGLQRHYGHRCLVLNKDSVREALYGRSSQVTYCKNQDDFVVSLLHLAAFDHLARDPSSVVILERTCTQAYQINDVVRLAAAANQALAVIHCWCPDDVARTRLDADLHNGQHPAGNRTFALHQHLQQTTDPLTVPALHLRTDTTPEQVLTGAVDYLAQILDTRTEESAR